MGKDITDPTLWAQFGLEGLVIFALFALAAWMVKLNINAINKQSDEHRAERKDWKDANNLQLDRFENSIRDLTAGIRNSK